MGAITTPAGLPYDEIRGHAERIGREHDIYRADGSADIDALLTELGGSVRVENTQESLHVVKPGSFVISVPTSTSPRRDRFTVAHELGHYVLHYLLPGHDREMAFGRGGRDRAETEANVFASTLLMPTEAFRAAFAELDGDAWLLARRFNVSPAAAQVRSQVLDLT